MHYWVGIYKCVVVTMMNLMYNDHDSIYLCIHLLSIAIAFRSGGGELW